jgi:hypothetical protein
MNKQKTMRKVFLLSSCDTWHSNISFNAIGVFSSLKTLICYLKKHVQLSEDDIYLLSTIHQTQGRDINYYIEEMTVNPKP